MKRGILCFMAVVIFSLPALAAAEVHGVYIAPKFLLGIQNSGQLSINADSAAGSKPFKQHSQAVFGGALAVGYNFGPKFNIPVRTEFEFALRSNASNSRDGRFQDGGDIVNWKSKQITNLSTLFFNAYFDIDTGTPFTPYIGGGLGMAFNYRSMRVRVEVPGEGAGTVSKSRRDTTFAWNVGAGLSYAFTENMAADLGYRFIHTGYSQITKRSDEGSRMKLGHSPYIHEFYLGMRFTF